MQLTVNGKTIDTDEQGYLVNLEDWSEALAQALADKDSLELTPAHWEVIHMIRHFYQENGTAPAMRALTKLAKTELGKEKGDSNSPPDETRRGHEFLVRNLDRPVPERGEGLIVR